MDIDDEEEVPILVNMMDDDDDDSDAPQLVVVEDTEDDEADAVEEVEDIVLDASQHSSLPPCPVTILAGFLGKYPYVYSDCHISLLASM